MKIQPMINQNSYVTLEKAIATSQELLTQYAFSDELLGDLTTAFGTEYNREVAEELVGQWQTGEFDSFPEIEIRSSTEINGANGAYSADTNKIYISEEYLLANTNNLKAISNLVIEEYGHYVDASINSVDAAGDEGAIFSGLVTGESFSEGELQQLQLENDKAVITLDGEEIAIEQQLIEAQTGLPITLPENFALREDLTNVLVGDFNNDGIDDFLRQEKGNGSGDGVNTADIFIADGNRDFSNISLPENLNIDGDLNNLHIGDFNGDGVDDILRQQKGSTDDDNPDTGRIYLNNGSGNFSVTRRISLPESLLIEGDLNNLHIGDFNGDGVDDILRQQKGSTDDDNEDTGRIYLNDGSGNFSVTRQI
ncbi:FG-GAP repeat domain-containing protein, partial [Hyella patelloides]|uniref:FG-GAP repeat domain-containing protein n=1 Tax=Hyella patelloides TaxID=1982969 RepID=UPI0011A535E4